MSPLVQSHHKTQVFNKKHLHKAEIYYQVKGHFLHAYIYISSIVAKYYNFVKVTKTARQAHFLKTQVECCQFPLALRNPPTRLDLGSWLPCLSSICVKFRWILTTSPNNSQQKRDSRPDASGFCIQSRNQLGLIISTHFCSRPNSNLQALTWNNLDSTRMFTWGFQRHAAGSSWQRHAATIIRRKANSFRKKLSFCVTLRTKLEMAWSGLRQRPA